MPRAIAKSARRVLRSRSRTGHGQPDTPELVTTPGDPVA
jgi:hypothetical protein